MKHNFSKKLLCGFLSFFTALSVFPISAYADTSADETENRFSGTVYLADLASDKITKPEPVTNGFSFGSYTLRYDDTQSGVFTKSIFNHAATNTAKRCSFDIADYTADDIAFSAYIGMIAERGGSTDSEKKGSAAFLLYADDTLLGKSGFLAADSPLTEFTATIPAGTQTLSIEQDAGSTADFDWCMWGNPKLTTNEKYLAALPESKVTKPNPDSNGSSVGMLSIRYSDTKQRTFMQSIFNHAADNTAKRYTLCAERRRKDGVQRKHERQHTGGDKRLKNPLSRTV